MKQIHKRLTYANVMSSLAVFLILGGATAFAAIKKVGANEIKANSIKTGKIVKEAVTAGKIKKNAITETKIADGAVTTNKLADNAVTTNKVANDAITGDKVKESTLGQVPSALVAASPTTLASGKTETGVYAFVGNGGGNGGFIGAALTFPFALAAVPTPHYITGGPTAQCPGTAANPLAAPGHLCAYQIEAFNTTGTAFFDNAFAPNGVTKFGAQIAIATPASTSNSNVGGVWAVTAP